MRRLHIVSYVSLITAFTLFVGTLPTYAASLVGTVTQPVTQVAATATSVLPITDDPTTDTSTPVSVVTDPVTNVLSAPTVITQPLTTSTLPSMMTITPSAQPTATTSTTDSSTPTTATATSARTTVRSTAAQSAALANGQSIDASGRIDYGSGQISQATANMLYRGAAIASAIGFILYALSSRRIIRMPFGSRTVKVAHS